MASRRNPDRTFARRLAALRHRTAATMWAEYMGLAHMYAAAGWRGKAAWALDGAAACRRHLTARKDA